MNHLASSITGDVALGQRLAKRMSEIAACAVKPRTVVAYRSDWAMWVAFAKHMEIPHSPAAGEHVAAFVTACADGLVFDRTTAGEVVTNGEINPEQERKFFTLKRYVTAISSIHRRAGKAFDSQNLLLKEVMRGLRQQKTTKQRRVKPLTVELLLDVVAAMPADNSAYRDCALLLLGVATGLRRSELVGLSLNELAGGDGILTIEEDGVLIELYESKTRTTEIETVFLPNGIAADAIRKWVAKATLHDGEPIFMRVYNGGKIIRKRLTHQSIPIILKKRLAAAGIDPNGFSGHSLRAGLVTSARYAGAANWDIQQVTRHTSASTLDTYTRVLDARQTGLAARIGLAG